MNLKKLNEIKDFLTIFNFNEIFNKKILFYINSDMTFSSPKKQIYQMALKNVIFVVVKAKKKRNGFGFGQNMTLFIIQRAQEIKIRKNPLDNAKSFLIFLLVKCHHQGNLAHDNIDENRERHW